MNRVYLDHNATTAMRPEVVAHLFGAVEGLRGNPSSVHGSGRRARAALDDARARVAAALRVQEDEIFFTSGGTESVHLALLGARPRGRARGLITSAAEHSCVLGAADAIAARGDTVLQIPVDERCAVDPEPVLSAVDESGIGLVSIMAANNEVGTIQPLAAIARGLASHGRDRTLFHTDAVQALGRIPVELGAWGVDLASFSAHKVGGPLGVGVLFKRRGIALEPQLRGGGQEAGLRAGSENVPAIAAAALAIELAVAEQPETAERMRALSRHLWHEVTSTLPDVELLGPPIDSEARLPNTLDLLVGRIDGRMLVARLDLEGLEASAGSACASGSLEPSHVLLAMGRSAKRARSGLRLSLGRETTREDVDGAARMLARAVDALR